MKTKVLSLITLLIIVSVISNPTFAANKKNVTATVISEASNFNKIEVSGNVEVYLIDGDANNVKVYNDYYGESALVQNQNGTLRIASYAKDALVVYVTVADLRSLSVYDSAVVKANKLSAIDLNINLYDNATAQLNLEAYNANIAINGHAKADLSGAVTVCNLEQNQSSTVNSTQFVAEHLTKKVDGLIAAVKNNQDLATI